MKLLEVVKSLPLAKRKFLVENVLGMSFNSFLTQDQKHLESLLQLQEFREKCELLSEGYPFDYLFGVSDFYNMNLKVDKTVLIPRKETEILIEVAISIIKNQSAKIALDLGTGSANIGLAIGRSFPALKVVSLDVSDVFDVARFNKHKYNVSNINFVMADLLNCFKKDSFDVIISNPPYVETAYLESSKSLKFEPRIALDGGEDGLFLSRKIIKQSFYNLKTGGFLILELGLGQIDKLISEVGEYKLVKVCKDYSGIDRILVLKKES